MADPTLRFNSSDDLIYKDVSNNNNFVYQINGQKVVEMSQADEITLGVSGPIQTNMYIQIDEETAPTSTTDKLYNLSGDLHWNGQNITMNQDPSLIQDADQDTKIETQAVSDTLVFTTSGTEKMRIQNDGKVGIGTDLPKGLLDVQVQHPIGEERVFIGVTAFQFDIGRGNLGLGVTNPQYTLEVAGDVVPAASNMYDLGTTGRRWRELHLSGDTLYIGGVPISVEVNVSGQTLLTVDSEEIVTANSGSGGKWSNAQEQGDIYYSLGYVGIGTDDPTKELDIDGDVGISGVICLEDYVSAPANTTNALYNLGGVLNFNGSEIGGAATRINDTGNTTYIDTEEVSDNLVFYTDGSERMRIESSRGNVGIGTIPNADASTRLQIHTPSVNDGNYIQLSNNAATARMGLNFLEQLEITSINNYPILLETNNTERMRIDSSEIQTSVNMQPSSDNTLEIGVSGTRFNNMHSSSYTLQSEIFTKSLSMDTEGNLTFDGAIVGGGEWNNDGSDNIYYTDGVVGIGTDTPDTDHALTLGNGLGFVNSSGSTIMYMEVGGDNNCRITTSDDRLLIENNRTQIDMDDYGIAIGNALGSNAYALWINTTTTNMHPLQLYNRNQTDSYILFRHTGTTQTAFATMPRIGTDNDDIVINSTETDGDIIFKTQDTERARILSDGKSKFINDIRLDGDKETVFEITRKTASNEGHFTGDVSSWPPIMTASASQDITEVITGQALSTLNGSYRMTQSAGASLSANSLPTRAFDGTTSGNAGYWQNNPNGGTEYEQVDAGAYLGSDNLTGTYPGQWLKIEMPYRLFLSSYDITSGNSTTRFPSEWKLFASNDDSTWEELHSESGLTSWGASFTTFNYAVTPTQAYKYFAIVVSKGYNQGLAYIGDLRFNGEAFSEEEREAFGVKYDDENLFVITPEGYVGIGVSNPTKALDINGELCVSGDTEITGHLGVTGDISAYSLSINENGTGTEYKIGARLAPAYDPEETLPPEAMTAQTDTLSDGQWAVTVSQTDGGGGSSGYGVFDKVFTAVGFGWGTSNGTYNDSDGTYLGATNLTGDYAGEWLKVQPPKPIRLRQYTMTIGGFNRYPNTFRLYGSNDDSNWIQLDEQSDVASPAGGRTDTYTVNATTHYSYFAIVVSIVGSSAQSSGRNRIEATGFREMELIGSYLGSSPNDGFGIQLGNDSIINIDTNGLVGIGMTEPNAELGISGSLELVDLTIAPSTTTDKLYNLDGDLFWDGEQLVTGSGGKWLGDTDIYYSGAVGIGTDTPDNTYPLTLQGLVSNNNNAINFKESGTNIMQIGTFGSNDQRIETTGGRFRIQTSNTYFMIDNFGSAIGTSASNSNALHLYASRPSGQTMLYLENRQPSSYIYFKDSLTSSSEPRIGIDDNQDLAIDNRESGKDIVFKTEDSERVRITSGGDLEVMGDLTVNGTTTTLNSNAVSIGDNIFRLADNNQADITDIGVYGLYLDTGVTKYRGLIHDASDSSWKLFNNETNEPSTTMTFGNTPLLEITDDGKLLPGSNICGINNDSFTIEARGNNNEEGLILRNNAGGTGTIRSQININESQYITFDTNEVERMRITNSGVGIGITNPTQNLEIYESSASTANKIRFTNSDLTSGADIGFDGAGNFEIRNSENTQIEFFTNGSERMTILADGNVGIGTNNPITALHVTSTSAGSLQPTLTLVNSDTTSGTGTSLDFINSDGTGQVFGGRISTNRDTSVTDQYMTFSLWDGSLTEKMTIQGSTGYVGIGITNPTEILHLHNSSDSSYLQFTSTNTGTTNSDGFFVGIDTDGDASLWNIEDKYIRFLTNDTERMRITNTGDVGIGTDSPLNKLDVDGDIVASGDITSFGTVSDARLKENVQNIPNTLFDILRLRPVDFNWKEQAPIPESKQGQEDSGFIAQELEVVYPKVVGSSKLVGGNGEDFKKIDYAKMVPYLVKAIQEQQTMINELKEKVEQLSN